MNNDEDRKRLRELQTYNEKKGNGYKKFKSENENDEKDYEYGKKGGSNDKIKESIKDKVDFKPSGLLSSDHSSNYKKPDEKDSKDPGVKLKWTEPGEARLSNDKWVIYPFKDGKSLDPLPIHKKKSFLFGRDRNIVDIPIDHPSCSSQHCVIVFREVNNKHTNKFEIKPYIIDLESTNGTFVNNDKIKSAVYFELRSKDIFKFGFSTREYVLLCESDNDNSDKSSDDSESDSDSNSYTSETGSSDISR